MTINSDSFTRASILEVSSSVVNETTHLRHRWEKDVDVKYGWICHYELVIPLDTHDIRREVYDENGEDRLEDVQYLALKISGPTKRSSNHVPCSVQAWDTPFRAGAHAQWDSKKLNNLPVYVVAPDGRTFRQPESVKGNFF